MDQLVKKYKANPINILEGSGWSQILQGTYQKKPVFIKVMNPNKRTLDDYRNEAYILKKLKDSSYATSFVALETLRSKDLALVTHYYPLVVTLPTSHINHQQVQFLRKNAYSILSQINFIIEDLRRRSILPLDFQLGVLENGRVVLIDVEAFQEGAVGQDFLYQFAKRKIEHFLSPYLERPMALDSVFFEQESHLNSFGR